MRSPELPSVGIFDSGVGGTTVLGHLRELLPDDDLLYLADQANCPYGCRSVPELRVISRSCTRWLLDRGAGVIVLACNTASAAALHWLRREFPETPFVGMVPAVKPAAARTRTGVVGVLATPGTIAGELLDDVVMSWAGATTVVRQPCPGLVERIEAGETQTPGTVALLEEYLRPLLSAGADTVVLGCTHYRFLSPQIRQITGPDVALIDAAPAVARQVARVLAERGRGRGREPGSRTGHTCYATTGDVRRFGALLDQLELPRGDVVAAELFLSEA